MADIELNPDDLSRAGGKLGDFGQQLAAGGQQLEDAGQRLISSASGDKSGIGAVVAKAFGEGVKITGKVFHEGGGWAERAGRRLHTHGELHQHNDEHHAKRLKGIRPSEEARGPRGGGGPTKAKPVGGGGKLSGAVGNIRNSGKSLKNKLGAQQPGVHGRQVLLRVGPRRPPRGRVQGGDRRRRPRLQAEPHRHRRHRPHEGTKGPWFLYRAGD